MKLEKRLTGVFPVLPTPFHEDGRTDEASLRNLIRYLIEAGVDGITFPGVASEFAQLSLSERLLLTSVVMDEVNERIPVIIGATSQDSAVSQKIAQQALSLGAVGLMVAAPAGLSIEQQIAHFSAIANAAPRLAIMLQNVPPPVGAGLEPKDVLSIAHAVPAVSYVKEEALPSGQRLSELLAGAPISLRGVFGGAGGRYITDELRRGACGTMPAIELAEVHVALYKAHRIGDSLSVQKIFTRMLPILNIQAVFRWSLTKYVLHRRGLITAMGQRATGPRLDTIDQIDVDAFLNDISDLLLPESVLRACVHNEEGVAHGAA
jgi:4-hydroxy-tetrahydrodipicolinate synthase